MPESHDDFVGLAGLDAEALDHLIEAGLDVGGVAPGQRERAARIGAVLGLLDVGAGSDRTTLIDVTMARVVRARASGVAAPELVPADQEALDAWIGAGYRDARVAPSLRERARVLDRMGEMITSAPVGDAPDAERLIGATLSRVQGAIDEERDRLRFETVDRGSRRMRLADIVSVAAVALIGLSVVWPIFTGVRHRGQVAACLGNFGSTASAMSLYAGANRDSLPMASASIGGPWWNVNPKKPSSNSANLFSLARGRYEPLSDLACPGNAHAPTRLWDENAHDWRDIDEISYSYQIMYGRERPLWRYQEQTVILTDRSPVVLRAVRGEWIDPDSNSPNHRYKGQHTLSTDGSAAWHRSPVLEDGDNIWLPRGLERLLEQVRDGGRIDLEGTETPESAVDVFVGP